MSVSIRKHHVRTTSVCARRHTSRRTAGACRRCCSTGAASRAWTCVWTATLCVAEESACVSRSTLRRMPCVVSSSMQLTCFTFRCDAEIYKNVTSLTERRVALNEACASRSDVCIDEFATCVTGTCKCIDNYHEKLGQCCECHQRRRRARACYVIITETSIPVTMVPRAVLWARLRLCSSRL